MSRSRRGAQRQEVDETDELTEEVCVLPPGKELVQVAPNTRAGGSHHQATSNPNEYQKRHKDRLLPLCGFAPIQGLHRRQGGEVEGAGRQFFFST